MSPLNLGINLNRPGLSTGVVPDRVVIGQRTGVALTNDRVGDSGERCNPAKRPRGEVHRGCLCAICNQGSGRAGFGKAHAKIGSQVGLGRAVG